MPEPRSARLPWVFLGGWTFVTFGLVLAKDGLSADNVTHLAILGLIALSFLALPLLRRAAVRRPRATFLVAALVLAAAVEGAYMISTPLHPSLRVLRGMGAHDVLRNLAVDLVLTTPAYAVIFTFIGWLVRRYDYATWEYALFIPAGQALGDGQAFFIANPAMLLFLPCILLNYQAMGLAAFVATRPQLSPGRGGALKYLLPLVGLPLIYGVCGTAIVLLGRRLGWLPAT